MRKILLTLIAVFFVIGGLASSIQAERAKMDEALRVANNWITLIIQQTGDWGGYQTAVVKDIQEFKRKEHVIGYFCQVDPTGFIVVSLHKELAPVKAYSTNTTLNPASEEALADLIKGKMEGILDALEEQMSTPGLLKSRQNQEPENIFEINYREIWEKLEANGVTSGMQLKSGTLRGNYQGGQILLTSHWGQDFPYNDDCPWKNCSRNPNGRTLVGCVATAGAQVMRYWNWPPYRGNSNDIYDWPNMPDILTGSSPQVQIDAVAKLSYEVGVDAGMDYGCEGSGACFSGCWGSDLRDTFSDNFRYSDADVVHRSWFFSAAEKWFNFLKGELNLNRPIPYRIPGHVVVADGWQEIDGIRQYHINYGWQSVGNCEDGCDTWYTLDAIYHGDPEEERVIVSLYPATSLGSSIAGTYARASFPYRYFAQDATGSSATFLPGQYLQFLPGITVRGISDGGECIKIEGTGGNNARLFTRGDDSKGVRIYDGAVTLRHNGGIRFY